MQQHIGAKERNNLFTKVMNIPWLGNVSTNSLSMVQLFLWFNFSFDQIPSWTICVFDQIPSQLSNSIQFNLWSFFLKHWYFFFVSILSIFVTFFFPFLFTFADFNNFIFPFLHSFFSFYFFILLTSTSNLFFIVFFVSTFGPPTFYFCSFFFF
jgi:hypothetical protein